MAIEAAHYEQTRARLRTDPVVEDMFSGAGGVKGLAHAQFMHEDGTPRFEFMLAANREYTRRGGDATQQRHIGAVAEVLVEKLKAQ